ncbi:Glycine--tRNA ligase [Astathelohania contejeani]|uniref:glycine--tRNA ligase n=1 Tax=Astathelohania contejeani TaxID=164912 RepID=A0ABQ7I1H1_9MICR|nr:Glycine--tRNA ligase [Thelohania contejeani]
MKFQPEKIDQLLKTKFFIQPTALIYGGISGLYDYGPFGCALKQNLINKWRQFFIDEEGLYEIDASILTPYNVLKASGHVEKFTDLLIFDQVNGECYRADHLLESELKKLPQSDEIKSLLNNIECLTAEMVDKAVEKYGILSNAGNKLGGTTSFNLMFKTQMGSQSNNIAYLRPETAQGQFVNFKKIYEINNEKLPFGTVSIGKVFRNEISPRGGLMRVREFEQAEIEYFVHPDEKTCPKFESLKELELNLLFAEEKEQTEHIMTLQEAVKSKIINNELLGYFIGRTFLFLKEIGIKPEYLRFRQHKKDEMAHYACDCWDAEILSSHGWIECVGIADRSCYDLSMHQTFSGVNLNARRNLKEPIIKKVYTPIIDKKRLGKDLKEEFPNFLKEIQKIQKELKVDEEIEIGYEIIKTIEYEGKSYSVVFKVEESRNFVDDFIPSVIEPSFGIGRILYSLIEHSFWIRENDNDRSVLSFKPFMAPVKCVISSLRNSAEFSSLICGLRRAFLKNNINAWINERSVSIGKKYASNDEVGVPFFVTLDPQTLEDGKATLRERDSMEQVRLNIEDIPTKVRDLCDGVIKWSDLKDTLGIINK